MLGTPKFDDNLDIFSIQDLKFLISLYLKRKKQIESNVRLSSKEKGFLIVEYNRRIMELRRTLKRKKTRRFFGVDSNGSVGNIQVMVVSMLNRLGFSNNTIYHDDAKALAERFYSSFEWDRYHGRYSNETLAACIVVEVLDNYMADYDFYKFLEREGIDFEDFRALYPIVNEWSNYYYWK